MYIKFELHSLPDLYFFPLMKFILSGCRCRRRKMFSFFLLFCKFIVNWGKNIHTVYQLGGKYAFSPLFSSPFNHFVPPTCYLAIFLPPNDQTEKYTPLWKGYGICVVVGLQINITLSSWLPEVPMVIQNNNNSFLPIWTPILLINFLVLFYLHLQ